MTDDERELLKQTALAVGAISQALADGYGIHDLDRLHRDVLTNVAAQFQRTFPVNGNSAHE